MKKIFLLGAAAVLSAFTAFSQTACEIEDGLYGSVAAPCTDTPPASVNIAGFEIWRGDLYEVTNVKVNGNYSVDICQGTGGTAWPAQFTIVAPSGAVEAVGLDAGSACELSFTASEAGTYSVYIHEVGECPAVVQQVDNGLPRVSYLGGANCDPPVTTCEAGVNQGVSASEICPGELTTLSITGVVVPNSPTQGDAFIEFTPTDTANTSGLVGQFVLTGFTAEDLAAYSFDNDLNGVLSSNSFPVMEGEWVIKGFVTSVDGTYFDPATRCDSTAAVATVDFFTAANPGCVPVTTCEAGILDQAGIDNELCLEDATDYTVTGITIPNSPVAGEYVIEFTPVPGSGSGGPFAGNPDPSFILTSAQIGAGDENVDLTISIDAQLLTTGAPQIPLEGEWSLRGAIFTDGVNPCDSVPAVVINFKGADEFPCGGPAPCELPYPQVEQSSLSVVQNPNNSITFSWDPIPGQIGCQVNAVVGALQPGSQQASFIVGGANASSFTAGAGQLNPFTTYNFRVRCGCQQNPSVIAGPYTDFISFFYLGASAIQASPDQGVKYAAARELQQPYKLRRNQGDIAIEPTFTIPSSASISKVTSKSKKASLEVYPNPATGPVNLNYEAAADGMVNVRVFDVVGKAVADYTMAVNEGANFLNLDLSSFENGVYVIEVREGQNSSTAKVVLK